jgi:cell division septation protein DedD
VSLILEALRKLEREKEPKERGQLVVGVEAWPSGSQRPRALGLFALGLAVGTAAVLLWLRRPAAVVNAPTSSVPAVSAPAAVATPAASALAPLNDASPVRNRMAATPESMPAPTARPAPVEPTATPAAGPRPEAMMASTTPAPAATPTPASGAPAAAGPAAAEPKFVLQAISEREGRPIAILNERFVREGDSLDGATVVRIGADEVELLVRGRRVVVKF